LLKHGFSKNSGGWTKITFNLSLCFKSFLSKMIFQKLSSKCMANSLSMANTFSWFGSIDTRHHFFHALFLKHRSWSMRHIHRTKARTNIVKRNTKRRNNLKSCNIDILSMDKSPHNNNKNNYFEIINSIDIILQQKQDRKKKHIKNHQILRLKQWWKCVIKKENLE
jgi:hypothetical protein